MKSVNLFVMAFVAFVALMCSACGASIQTYQPEIIREFPEPPAGRISDEETETTVTAVDAEPETVTFVVDGYDVPVTPAPVTIYGAGSAEEAERWLDEADIIVMGCERAVTGEREAWVCMP